MRVWTIHEKQSEYRWTIEDLLLFSALILQDAGTFGIFPLNIFQMIILGMGMILGFKKIINQEKIDILKPVIFLLLYIIVITFLNEFDGESIKSVGFFAIQLVVLCWYLQRNRNYSKLYHIIYQAGFLLALYGVIQEIAYITGIPAIYDTTLYGFVRNGTYAVTEGGIRVMSLYAEPAHLSGILAAALYIGLIGKGQNKNYVSTVKNIIIVLCALLTQSILVYISVGILAMFYLFTYKREFLSQLKWLFVAIVVVAGICIVQPQFMEGILGKLGTLGTASATSTNDLSAFAVVSNFRIALEKMKDGFLFGTGFDSHRLYYEQYINQLYTSVLMHLNSGEAASLFTRIFSEFGVVGLFAFIAFLLQELYASIKERAFELSFFAILLVLQGMRTGHYTYMLITISLLVLLEYRSRREF